MDHPDFRLRIADAAARVTARTGVDPLDVSKSIAVTSDARLELLPVSVGIGLTAMAAAVTLASVGFLSDPARNTRESDAWFFVIVDVLLIAGALACVALARNARSRRPQNWRYEDAWARFALEIWPAQRGVAVPGLSVSAGLRLQPRGGGAPYSRTEFLLSVQSGVPLDRYFNGAPFTRMP